MEGNCGLFLGNFSDSRTEPFRVIQGDRGKDADIGGNGGGRIETATHARFENDEFAIALAEMPHCQSESEFEEGGMRIPVGD